MEAWLVFQACRTQWRTIAVNGGAKLQGLDYGAVDSIMKLRGIEDTDNVFRQVQRIEAGAIEAMNAKA